VADTLGSWEALLAFRAEAAVPVQHVDVGHGPPALPDDFWVHGPSELRVSARGEPVGVARLAGPVTKPLAEAVADVVGYWLTTPFLLWAERAGAPLAPDLEPTH
jgi:hypothetical protein